MHRNFIWIVCALAMGISQPLRGETLSGLGGAVKLEAPAAWKVMPPKSRIVEYEFQAPGGDGKDPARVTCMSASGSIDDNIQRWIGQFKLTEGTEPKKEKTEVAGCVVHVVEIEGTFKETMGGPFAPGPVVEKPDHAMLGAIIAKGDAKYFVKMVGSKAVVQANRDAFKKMVNEVKSN